MSSRDLTLAEYQQAGVAAVYKVTAPTLQDGDEISNLVDESGNAKQTLATALDRVNDSVTDHVAPADSKIGITASAQVLSGPGVLYGFTIVSHTAGATVRFSDALTATTPYVSSAWTSVAGHLAGINVLLGGINGMQMATGCYVTITGTIELIPLVKLD